MDDQSFDTLARMLHAPGTRRRALAALLGAALLPATAPPLLASRRKKKRRGKRGPAEVTVCRNGKTFVVPSQAVAGIISAGGTTGACGSGSGSSTSAGTGPRPTDQPGCERVLRAAGCSQVSDGVSLIWTCPENTNLNGANLAGCNLIGARLIRVLMNDVRLEGSILNNAHLDGAQLHGGFFRRTDFVQAIARQANFGGGKDFVGADMREADFTGASFNSADLHDADLTRAILQNADLRGVVWTGATCPDEHLAIFTNCCGHLNGWTTPFC
jgi:hypothetical protein